MNEVVRVFDEFWRVHRSIGPCFVESWKMFVTGGVGLIFPPYEIRGFQIRIQVRAQILSPIPFPLHYDKRNSSLRILLWLRNEIQILLIDLFFYHSCF